GHAGHRRLLRPPGAPAARGGLGAGGDAAAPAVGRAAGAPLSSSPAAPPSWTRAPGEGSQIRPENHVVTSRGRPMILIAGAGGMFGGGVRECLLKLGAPGRGLPRSADRAATIRSRGAEAAVGDLDEPDSLPAALRGVDRVFLVSAMDEHIARRE